MMSRDVEAGTSSKWIVIATHPDREAFAIENLQRQNYEAYCPMILKRIRHARKTYDARRPLFPNYIFMKMIRDHWRPVLGTYGVRSVLCNREGPAYLPFGFVENLKAREVGDVIGKPEETLKPGQAVKINCGQFDGAIGHIIQVREHDRVLLLLDMLNQKVKVSINAGSCSPVRPEGTAETFA